MPKRHGRKFSGQHDVGKGGGVLLMIWQILGAEQTFE
jgi:hypothetical protein